MKDYYSIITVNRTDSSVPLYALIFPLDSERVLFYKDADELQAKLIAFGFTESGAATALEALNYKDKIEPAFRLSAEQFAELTGPRANS